MTHERVVLALEPSTPLEPVLRAATRFAPDVTHLFVVVTGELSPAELEQVLAHYDGAPVELSLEQHFDLAQLPLFVRAREATLLVAGAWPTRGPRSRVLTLLEVASPNGVDVLSVGARVSPRTPRTGLAALTMHVKSSVMAATTRTVLQLPELPRFVVLLRGATKVQALDFEPALRALLPGRELTVRPMRATPGDASTALRDDEDVELLVVATDDLWSATRTATALLAADALELAPKPVLILHHAPEVSLLTSTLTATTVPFPAGRATFPVLIEQTSVRGRATLARDETFALVGAEERGALPHHHGVVELPLSWVPAGARRVALRPASNPALAAQVRFFKPEKLLVADTRVSDADLELLERMAATHTIVFVRLRGHETLADARTRLGAKVPWQVRLIDASALLDDGGAGDVPESADHLRLRRVAARLGAQVLHGTPPAGRTLRSTGNSVTLQFDNQRERRRLLDAIAGATAHVHWQSYIVDVDAVSIELIEALRDAAVRGVRVRVLVDALYSRHDVYGVKNPVLERLDGTPNLELRAWRPFVGVPSLLDLKQRNHRKLVLVDGRAATLSGRNTGATYYRGFDELQLTPETPYRDVPWFDASAAVEGPLVEQLERAFLADWLASGGEGFEVAEVAAQGRLDCELVLHEGANDTRTLDTLLKLVHSARRRLLVVNTFPLVLELQRALSHALARGVEVRFVFGNVRPRWGAQNQLFPGGAVRALGDNLVRARLDPLLRAGAKGYEFGVAHAGLGALWPHVHAKLYVRDDEVVATGSANVDVSSAYWESEALLLIHDASFARDTLKTFDALLAQARPVDPDAQSWAEDADRRSWLARNWPSIMG